MRLAQDVRKIIRLEETQLALIDDVQDKIRTQTTLVEGVRVLVESLKENQGDPVKLAAIIAGLDANNLALDLMDNVEPPPTP